MEMWSRLQSTSSRASMSGTTIHGREATNTRATAQMSRRALFTQERLQRKHSAVPTPAVPRTGGRSSGTGRRTIENCKFHYNRGSNGTVLNVTASTDSSSVRNRVLLANCRIWRNRGGEILHTETSQGPFYNPQGGGGAGGLETSGVTPNQRVTLFGSLVAENYSPVSTWPKAAGATNTIDQGVTRSDGAYRYVDVNFDGDYDAGWDIIVYGTPPGIGNDRVRGRSALRIDRGAYEATPPPPPGTVFILK